MERTYIQQKDWDCFYFVKNSVDNGFNDYFHHRELINIIPQIGLVNDVFYDLLAKECLLKMLRFNINKSYLGEKAKRELFRIFFLSLTLQDREDSFGSLKFNLSRVKRYMHRYLVLYMKSMKSEEGCSEKISARYWSVYMLYIYLQDVSGKLFFQEIISNMRILSATNVGLIFIWDKILHLLNVLFNNQLIQEQVFSEWRDNVEELLFSNY